MPLVKIDRVRFATDQSMATITNTSGSAFRSALADLIQAIAVGIISGNPTIVAAAEAAVAAALSAQRIVLSRIVSSTGGTWTDLNAVDATLPVTLDVRNTALNRPITAAVSCVGWHIPSGNGSAVQFLTTSGTVPSQWMRSKASGVWGPWVQIVDTAVLEGVLTARSLVLSRVVASTGGTWTDLDAVDSTLAVTLDVRNTALNRPISAAVSCLGWHIPSGNGSAVQILTSASANPSQWMRSKASGVWSPWLRIVDQGVLDARVAGLPAELRLVQLEKCIHLESGVWVWDGPAAPAATHYLLPDDTGALVARSTPFPVPSASAPELTW